jgi:hypothetical protein
VVFAYEGLVSRPTDCMAWREGEGWMVIVASAADVEESYEVLVLLLWAASGQVGENSCSLSLVRSLGAEEASG